MHIDLVRLQAEYGANKSYRKASKDLNCVVGKRSINNHMRIRKVTIDVGEILSEKVLNVDEPVQSSEELCSVVDGGHVHDARNPGHNFEVMSGKVFKPNNVIRIDKHHTKITKKHCAGSGKYDNQKTMKANIAMAAQQEGIDKTKTTVIALADGAKNCRNILESLIPLCLTLICILDWFHIGKYIQRIKTMIPNSINPLDEIKNLLFHGKIDDSLSAIQLLLDCILDENHKKVISNFHQYILDNINHLVDYAARKEQGLVYTSHVAESTVEHLINERFKRKQKMQWSRDGLHAVIQIRVSQASDDWDDDWEKVIKPKLMAA